jgi:hypothetical protein
MGAASAIEAAACCLAIKMGVIPPTINYENSDPECDIDCVPNKSRKKEIKIALNNSLAFGGNKIKEALQKKISANHGPAGEQTIDVCRRFCRELENTIEFLLLNETLQKYPQKITLTGEGYIIDLVQKELEGCFSLPVEILDLGKSRQIQIEDILIDHFQPRIMNGALAVALRSASSVRSFNFRQGEFKPGTAVSRLRGLLKWAAPVAGLILALMAGNQYLDYRLQAQRLDDIKKQISFLFKKDYPEAATMVDPLQQLKTKLADNKKTFGFYEGGQEITVLDLLKEISGFIGPSLDVIISSFSYENDVVLIKGEAKNIDAVSAIKSELMKSKYFKEVLIGSTNLARQGSKVDFDLRIMLK